MRALIPARARAAHAPARRVSAGASAVLRTTMSRSCRRCSCRRRPTCRRCPTACRRPASSAAAVSSGCRAIRLTATAGRPRMSRQDRLAWIVIGDSVAVVRLGFGAIRHGDHYPLRASVPASPSTPLDGVFGIRGVPPASPCGSSPQSYDDAVRSGRRLLRRSKRVCPATCGR